MLKDVNQPQDILEKLNAYDQNPKGFLLLAGKPGTGKTFAAEAIYNNHTNYRLPYFDHDKAAFISQVDLNDKWLESIKKYGDASYYKEIFGNTPLLVLDDLGTKAPTDSFIDFLYSLLDTRWKKRETNGTIITTNFSAETIHKIFGDRLLSRILSGKLIKFEGDDRRIDLNAF